MATLTYYGRENRVTPLYRATQVVWYVVGVIEALLAARFILRLIGANPAAGFTNFVYDVSQPFVQPFLNVVRTSRVETGSVVDWNVLIAMAVYWLAAWAIVRLFFMGRPVSETEADYEIRKENHKL